MDWGLRTPGSASQRVMAIFLGIKPRFIDAEPSPPLLAQLELLGIGGLPSCLVCELGGENETLVGR
jgi:hypothetical protein